MDFNQEDLANLSIAEQEELAEQLGIPISSLTLKPQ